MDRKDISLGKWPPNWKDPLQIINVFSNNSYKTKELGFKARTLRINGKYLKNYKPMMQEIWIIEE